MCLAVRGEWVRAIHDEIQEINPRPQQETFIQPQGDPFVFLLLEETRQRQIQQEFVQRIQRQEDINENNHLPTQRWNLRNLNRRRETSDPSGHRVISTTTTIE